MSRRLDMSLDEIIRNESRSEVHSHDSRPKPRRSGPGPDRRRHTREPLRTHPYPVRPQMQMQIQVPLWQRQLVSNRESVEAKLCISNLDYGVSNEDIKVLFSEIGELKRYSINYDKSGRSKGTAEVVFFRQMDALAAIKRYNNVQLDGKPMTIELVGANVVMAAPVPPTKSSILGKPNVAYRRDQEKVGGRGWVRGGDGDGGGRRPKVGGAGRGFARGRGRGGQAGKKLSAEDLDADLDNYHLEATRIK
ncbi:hypothetical protein REPUB_Repub03eG0207200 [Reevesia pubescens]